MFYIKIFTTELLKKPHTRLLFEYMTTVKIDPYSWYWAGLTLVFVGLLVTRKIMSEQKKSSKIEVKSTREPTQERPKPKDPPKNDRTKERALGVARSSVGDYQSHPSPRLNQRKIFLVPMGNGSSVLMQIRPEGIRMLSHHQIESGELTTQHITGHHITAERISSRTLASRQIRSRNNRSYAPPTPSPSPLPPLETNRSQKAQIDNID